MTDAPERIFGSKHTGQDWRFADCAETGCDEVQEYARKEAIDTARAEGRRAGLEEAAERAEQFTTAKHLAGDISAGVFPKQSPVGEAIGRHIRALIDTPPDPSTPPRDDVE